MTDSDMKPIFTKEAVFRDLSPLKKEDMFRELSVKLAAVYSLDESQLLTELWKREILTPTALGHTVAIPHCFLGDVDSIYIGLGLCDKGMEFQAPDGEKVKIIFVIIAPKGQEDNYLSMIAFLARILRRESNRQQLFVKSNEEIVDWIGGGVR